MILRKRARCNGKRAQGVEKVWVFRVFTDCAGARGSELAGGGLWRRFPCGQRSLDVPFGDAGAFLRADYAADLKTVYFRYREVEPTADAAQSVFQSAARDCSSFSHGSAFDGRPKVSYEPRTGRGFQSPCP